MLLMITMLEERPDSMNVSGVHVCVGIAAMTLATLQPAVMLNSN